MGECRGRRWIAPPHAREDGGIEGRGHGVEEEGHAGRVLAAIAGRGRRTYVGGILAETATRRGKEAGGAVQRKEVARGRPRDGSGTGKGGRLGWCRGRRSRHRGKRLHEGVLVAAAGRGKEVAGSDAEEGGRGAKEGDHAGGVLAAATGREKEVAGVQCRGGRSRVGGRCRGKRLDEGILAAQRKEIAREASLRRRRDGGRRSLGTVQRKEVA